MSTVRRFSYSLLISTLVFSLFAVLAFSGLFPWIEAQFYSPKVVADLQVRLGKAESGFDRWKAVSLERLDKVLDDGVFEGVFSPVASREAILGRYQVAKLFLVGARGGGTLRILNANRSEVHFSTEDSDVKSRSDFSLTYRPFSEILQVPDLKAATLADGTSHVLADPAGRSVFFLHPWTDRAGKTSGFALLSLSLEDWRLSLTDSGAGLSDSPVTALGPQEFLFSLLGRTPDPSVVDRVKALSSQGILPPVQHLARTDGGPSLSLVHQGRLSLIIPSASLELDGLLKALLMISLFTVVFLIVFLLANLRGEPLSVVTRKVKRFQLQVVKQYLDLKEQDKIQSLRDELARHSSEIRDDVRRSLGRVRRRDQEWIDRYIDTSWQEVMDLLRGPSPPVESSSNADWKRLETLLQQALTQGRFVVSGPAVGPSPMVSSAGRPRSEEPEEVEELADEAEDIEELDAVEELSDAEDLEDAEELEAVDDPEEVEVLEADEEVEELGELEVVEDEDEPLDPQGSVALPSEEAEALEELEGDDMEEPEGRESGHLEELEPLNSPTSVFHARGRTPAEGAVTILPASPEDPDDELEVLEEFEDAGDDDAASVSRDLSYPLERLDGAWGTLAAEVFDDTGDVVRLKEDVFSEIPSAHDTFGMLVDQVLAGPDGDGFVPLDREDLVPLHLPREWRWTGAGFDWDRFALGIDEVNLFRALSEMVTEFDAFTAAILTEDEDRWVVQSSVGFSDAGKAVLDFGPESSLSRQFLRIRALHVLYGGAGHPVLRQSFHPKDMKFLKSVLCVPLLFRHQPAWLLLGLRHEPKDILNLLSPRRVG